MSFTDRIPENVGTIQQDAARDADPEDLWVTDVPVCLQCHSANPTAYGGGKATFEVDGHTFVTDGCHECEHETVQVL